MQTSQVKTCKNCLLITELLEKLNKKLWELSEHSLNSLKFNTSDRVDSGLVSDLLHFKRILTKKVLCGDYLKDYSVQDIAKVLLPKINSSKKCLCFSLPPAISTTTSSTTTTTTTL